MIERIVSAKTMTLMCLSLLLANIIPAFASTGPLSCGFHVYAIDSAVGPVEGTVDGERWRPTDTNYDRHLTAKGRKIEHSHALSDFPVLYPTGSGLSDDTITASECDAFFSLQYPEGTIASTATTAMNCHGYTTGRSFWVEPPASGIGRVVQDEYAFGLGLTPSHWFTRQVGGGSQGEREHSLVALEWVEVNFGSGTIWVPYKFFQKWSASPVMESSWEWLGGYISSDFNLMYPKN